MWTEDCPSVSPVDLVEAAFFLCSYELSIKSLHSPWCFLFDENDAKVQTRSHQQYIILELKLVSDSSDIYSHMNKSLTGE